jgi:hypothetical protein
MGGFALVGAGFTPPGVNFKRNHNNERNSRTTMVAVHNHESQFGGESQASNEAASSD